MRKFTGTCLFSAFFFLMNANAQTTDTNRSITIPASKQYYKNTFYKKLWGEHYRKVWHTPVTFTKVSLDTLAGGLVPYEAGGGRQSLSLKLRDKNQREYVLRSVDKTFGRALPEIAQGTFIENMANDQVTLSNPYGALVVAPLAEAAGILHTNPQIFYVPKQPALKEFNDSHGDRLFLFEQRPDEDWETAANFGNSKKIIGTDKLLEKLNDDNDNVIDQHLYARSRLFDMFIGDWGRHEDQWRWAKTEEGKMNIYKPIPRDRDNAFSKLDGFLLSAVLPPNMQDFDYDIKKVKEFNSTARNLDRRALNELSFSDWNSIAKDLQQRLTDEVIANAISKLPKEILPIAGDELFKKLRTRRQFITLWAEDYYLFMNKGGIHITGSKKKEYFEVNNISDTETEVSVFKITNEGDRKENPFYTRTFDNKDTKEIRLFGLDGDDEYVIKGNAANGIPLVIVGGPGNEKFSNESPSNKGKQITFYDDKHHQIIKAGNAKLKFGDKPKYEYVYDYFKYDKSGFKPIIFYNQDDRIHIGAMYNLLKQKWNKNPFWQRHQFLGKYSLEQKGFSLSYQSKFIKALGNWDLNIYSNWDQVRWLHFFGLGNESEKNLDLDNNYYRLRSKQISFDPSIERTFSNRQRIKIGPFFQIVDPITDTARYVFKSMYGTDYNYQHKTFTGAALDYVYQVVNDSILPTKGFAFVGNTSYSHPLYSSGMGKVAKIEGSLNFYIPVSKTIGFSVRGGASTLSGKPEIFQYNTIGGNKTFRGVQRDRYHGNSTFYNQNEIRWIKDVRSYIYNGKIGIFGLYDVGRVWLKTEKSDKWHYGYGGGLILAPFNKIAASIAYAKSGKEYNIHLGLFQAF